MGEAAGRSARGDGRGAMSLTGQDLNELCSENYLDGLAGASVSELRSLRDACQRAEAVLSYLRRVIQGNIDLVVAESKVRQDGGHSDLGRLVDELPSILASSGPLAEDTDHVSVRSIKAVTQILDLQHDLALEAARPKSSPRSRQTRRCPVGCCPAPISARSRTRISVRASHAFGSRRSSCRRSVGSSTAT